MRTTKHEENFIDFCRDVSEQLCSSKPYWVRNVNRFRRIFFKYLDGGKSHLPIVDFINSHRETLERKVVDNCEPNDSWLHFDTTSEVPVSKSMGATEPRGVYLPMKQGDWDHSLPLSEVYHLCVNPEVSHLKSFSGVTMETVPAKFFNLFYNMLSEAEPENEYFKENVRLSDDEVEPFTGMDLNNVMSTMMNSDMMCQFGNLSQNLAESLKDVNMEQVSEGFQKFTSTGDFSSLLNSAMPVLQKSGLMNMVANLTNNAAGGASQVQETGDPDSQD